jgi:hypothetical protein
LPIFGEKNGIFLNNQFYDTIFAKTSSSWSKKRHFLPKNVIITLVFEKNAIFGENCQKSN